MFYYSKGLIKQRVIHIQITAIRTTSTAASCAPAARAGYFVNPVRNTPAEQVGPAARCDAH